MKSKVRSETHCDVDIIINVLGHKLIEALNKPRLHRFAVIVDVYHLSVHCECEPACYNRCR